MNTHFLLINSVLCFLFAGINLAYYFKHANGKKNIRLFSGIVLAIFGGAFLLATLYPSERWYLFVNIWFGVIAMLPVLDTITDWTIKNKAKTK